MCGSRQGDPLSLFLFIFCSEGLSSLLCLVHANDLFLGAQASRGGPRFSHLLFADDSLIFAFIIRASWIHVFI